MQCADDQAHRQAGRECGEYVLGVLELPQVPISSEYLIGEGGDGSDCLLRGAGGRRCYARKYVAPAGHLPAAGTAGGRSNTEVFVINLMLVPMGKGAVEVSG